MKKHSFIKTAFQTIMATIALSAMAPAAFADCVNPPAVEGEMVYNTSYHVMQYCSGTAWVSMAGSAGGSGGTATPAGSIAGAVQFRGSTAVLAADDANFVWDNTNKRLGIGTVISNFRDDGDDSSATGADPVVIAASANQGLGLVTASTIANLNYHVVNAAGNRVRVGVVGLRGAVNTTGSESGDVVILTKGAADAAAIFRLVVSSTGSVSIGAAAPDANAALDIQSTTKGLLLPRMTTAQVATLDTATSTNGMLVYDTDTGQVKVQTGGTFVVLGSGSGSGGTNTMISGWPDAIRCYGASGSIPLYHSYYNASGVHEYVSGWTTSAASDNMRVRFTSAGVWSLISNVSVWTGYYETNCNSAATTISTLYTAGNAYNFIGNGSMAAAGTAGQVQFNQGGNMQADAGLTWDNTNKRLGVGTATPDSDLHIVSTGSSSLRGFTTSQYSTDSSAARINFVKARGTQAVPTTAVDGDVLANVSFQTFGTTMAARANIFATVNGTVTGDTVPVDLSFNTAGERLRIMSDGRVGIGMIPTVGLTLATEPRLQVAGAIVSTVNNAAAATTINFATSNVAYTSAACGAITLQNMADGGSYSLIVKGNGTGPAVFTHAGLTPKSTGTLTCAANKHTVFSFIRAGTDFYVTMITGY